MFNFKIILLNQVQFVVIGEVTLFCKCGSL